MPGHDLNSAFTTTPARRSSQVRRTPAIARWQPRRDQDSADLLLDLPVAPSVWETRDAEALNGLDLLSWISGISSLTGTLLALLCIFAGPFTCFVSWIFAYYICLWGLPVHVLALGIGMAGEFQQDNGATKRGCTFAVSNGFIGCLLSGMALATAHGLIQK